MSDKQATITIPVDPTNPDQFLARCDLLELADRLRPGVLVPRSQPVAANRLSLTTNDP